MRCIALGVIGVIGVEGRKFGGEMIAGEVNGVESPKGMLLVGECSMLS